MTSEAQPILKWAGGKRQLLPEILPRLPAKIRTYYEPFIGGGAVFFSLANEKRFDRAVLTDANEELINLYTVLRDDVGGLVTALAAYVYSESFYYSVRGGRPDHPVSRAARTIYLNRAGFNGLYRVNKRGEFNVPFGRYTNPTICNEPALRAASEALQGVDLICGDFEQGVHGAEPGDAVYFDPPYVPVSQTSNFHSYQAGGFGATDHGRLEATCRKLEARGIPFLLSNSDTRFARQLYMGFKVETVSATRRINKDASKRGAVSELLVSTHSVAAEATGT